MKNETNGSIRIQQPRDSDLPAILAVIRECGPFLTARPYISWMAIRCFRETCAVAELDGHIVGWRSAVAVSPEKVFIHELGVSPAVRRQGVGRSLLEELVNKLTARRRAFQIEFTCDRRNSAVLELNRTIAERAGMLLTKKPDRIPLIVDSEEDVYAMSHGAFADHPRPEAIADAEAFKNPQWLDICGRVGGLHALCNRSWRAVGARAGVLASFLLADLWPGFSIDHARCLVGRLFELVRK